MPEEKKTLFYKSPWGILSIGANALGIGNFQENYFPQILKWRDFFHDIFGTIDEISKFCLIPLERIIQFVLQIPDWVFPPTIASYFVLNAVLMSSTIGQNLTRHIRLDIRLARERFQHRAWPIRARAIGLIIVKGLIECFMIVVAPGILFLIHGIGFMQRSRKKIRAVPTLFYGLFSIACLVIMLMGWNQLGRIAGLLSASTLYLIALGGIFFEKFSEKGGRKEAALKLLGGPAIFVILAFVFSDYSA